MDSTTALAGTVVLVTRPAHQADELCRLIESCGGTALRMPTLEIRPLTDPSRTAALRAQLERADIALFTSANAARFSLDALSDQDGWLNRVRIGVVGQATARALAARGITATLRPERDFSSVGMLALPALQQVKGQRIVIIRGEGGRELLADTLRERGAAVEYAEVYRRCRPDGGIDQCLTAGQRDSIDVVVTTSNESLQNLYAMAGGALRQWLCGLPLVVVSERAAQLAEELGFTQRALVSAQASDEAIVATLCAWAQHTKGMKQ